jgi:excisionase family DNA binding protein
VAAQPPPLSLPPFRFSQRGGAMDRKSGMADRKGTLAGDGERLLGVREAAAFLSVKPGTLYQWAYQRRIPVVKLFGRRGALRFRECDIRALIGSSLRPALRRSTDRELDP